MVDALEEKENEAMAALSPEDRSALLLFVGCLDPGGKLGVTAAFVQPDVGPAFVCVTDPGELGISLGGILATLAPTSDGWESTDEWGGEVISLPTLAALADHLRRPHEEVLAATLRNGGWIAQPPQVAP